MPLDIPGKTLRPQGKIVAVGSIVRDVLPIDRLVIRPDVALLVVVVPVGQGGIEILVCRHLIGSDPVGRFVVGVLKAEIRRRHARVVTGFRRPHGKVPQPLFEAMVPRVFIPNLVENTPVLNRIRQRGESCLSKKNQGVVVSDDLAERDDLPP